jgi:hypothetical protein
LPWPFVGSIAGVGIDVDSEGRHESLITPQACDPMLHSPNYDT